MTAALQLALDWSTPVAPPPKPPGRSPIRDLAERFVAYTDRSGGCWLWTANVDRDGYAKMSFRGVTSLAHRVSYEHHVGPVPDGHELDHKCRVRRCINPAHLEPVPHVVNIHRGSQTWQGTRCARGHELTPENVRRHGNKRQCRVCQAANQDRRECGLPPLPRATATGARS